MIRTLLLPWRAIMNIENVVDGIRAGGRAGHRARAGAPRLRPCAGAEPGRFARRRAEAHGGRERAAEGSVTELEQAPRRPRADERRLRPLEQRDQRACSTPHGRASLGSPSRPRPTPPSAVAAGERRRERDPPARPDRRRPGAGRRSQAGRGHPGRRPTSRPSRPWRDAEAAKAALEAEAQADRRRPDRRASPRWQAKVDDLKAQRTTIKDQLTTAQTHIAQLLTLVHGDAADEQS